MRNIPKTTEFTLKRIVENLAQIPNKGFSEETPKLSTEQKQKLMEMASMFETFGEYLGKEDTIMQSAKSMSEFCTLAEAYAVNECGDWFQQDIIRKDMATMKKHVTEYQKAAKECYAKMQQLGVLFEDVKHLASRYYDLEAIAEGMETSPSQPISLEEKTKSK